MENNMLFDILFGIGKNSLFFFISNPNKIKLISIKTGKM